MKIAVLALVLALAGCADVPLEEAEASDPRPLQALRDPAFVHTIDMTEHLEDGTVKLFAFKAAAPAQIDGTESMELSYAHDGASASMGFMRMDAPVDAMLARADGDVDAAMENPLGGGHGGGGGCGGGVDPTIRVGGETLFTSPVSGCSAGSSGGGAFTGGRLDAGAWLLIAAGACGFSAEDLDGNDHWSFTIASNQTLEMIELPPAPFACGLGFDAYYDTNIVGIRDGGASFSMDTVYGGSIMRGPMTGDAEADGTWTINGTTLPIDEGDFLHIGTQVAGPVGFDVATSDGFGPIWTIVGL